MKLIREITQINEYGGYYDFSNATPDKKYIVMVYKVEGGEPRLLLQAGKDLGVSVEGRHSKPELFVADTERDREHAARVAERKGVTGNRKVIAVPAGRRKVLQQQVATRWDRHVADLASKGREPGVAHLKPLKAPLGESITIPWTGPIVFPDELVPEFLNDHGIVRPGLSYENINRIASLLSDCMSPYSVLASADGPAPELGNPQWGKDTRPCVEWRGFEFTNGIYKLIRNLQRMFSPSNTDSKCCGPDSNTIVKKYPDVNDIGSELLGMQGRNSWKDHRYGDREDKGATD